ncbi:MAG TPA: hypothetical protein VFV87_08145, partial [Pirellulaceae bacterium]|nr:hypothetical protein [Pirellulaceae bacterium]
MLEEGKGVRAMSKNTASTGLAALGLAALALAGCGTVITGPTKQIRSPEPQTVFTSMPIPGDVKQARYEEPLEPIRAPGLKPFAAWNESDAAADALGRIGPPAVPALAQALH